MAMNLASKYSNKVDERFTRDSQALMGTNKDYDWNGVDTVIVYQVDTVPLNDYTRSGANRYGVPTELGNTIQEMKLNRDRSFTFTIDKANRNQTMMVMEAGKSLAREEREVIVPEYDTYVFNTQANAAIANGHVDLTAASTQNAYALFLKASEVLGNKNVPDAGRIAYCTYGFANLMMQDPAFIKYGDKSQDMVIKGILGEVDGTKIVKVPASRLPKGMSFMIVHPCATVAPQQLKEYKTHQDPPGINGDLVEGRHLYDCFVLDAKKDALYVCMGSGELFDLGASVVDGKLVVDPLKFAGELKIKAGTTLPTYGAADTGYTAVKPGDAVSASSIIAVCVDGKIIGASKVTVA